MNVISVTNHSECQNVEAQTGGKRRVLNGFLNALIDKQKKENGVMEFISPDTICTHVNQGRLMIKHQGVASSVKELEDFLVNVVIQMCKISQTLSCDKALGLANIFINCTPAQQ